MSTTNWWQQAKKSHPKLQTAARRSAPLAAQNADESSRFVECPACGASMHRQSLNHHLDLDCPVLHGYGDQARGSDASSTARSSIQSGPRESDAAAPARLSDASRYAACPVCSESVLLSDMNYHLELRCRGATAEAPAAAAPAAEELVAADAIGACPLCDQKMPLVAIADHIDAGCPQISAAAPSLAMRGEEAKSGVSARPSPSFRGPVLDLCPAPDLDSLGPRCECGLSWRRGRLGDASVAAIVGRSPSRKVPAP